MFCLKQTFYFFFLAAAPDRFGRVPTAVTACQFDTPAGLLLLLPPR